MKKERDYKKENARKLEKNKMYCITLDKNISSKLDEKLKKENLTTSKWFRENAIKYIQD